MTELTATCEICQRVLPLVADADNWGADEVNIVRDPYGQDLYNLSDVDSMIIICGKDYEIRHDDL